MTRPQSPRNGDTADLTKSWRIAGAHAAALIRYNETRLVLDHWLSLNDRSGLPGRGRLDPLEIAGALANLFLMDYVHDEGRLRYRLVGDEVRRRYQNSLVGKHLDEVVEADAYPRVSAYFLACPQTPAIAILTGRLFHEWEKPGYGERLLMPLFAEDGPVEGLLGVTVCKKTFDDRRIAAHSSDRRLHIIPLDGSGPTELKG